MIDFTKPLRVDTPARAGMGAVDAPPSAALNPTEEAEG